MDKYISLLAVLSEEEKKVDNIGKSRLISCHQKQMDRMRENVKNRKHNWEQDGQTNQ